MSGGGAPTGEQIAAAACRLHGVAVRTPLLHAPGLAAALGVPVYLKCEQLQPMGAFKIRGAFTALDRLDPAARARGVVAFSSGNHAQGVAAAARHFGVRAVIVMPASTPQVKVEGVRRFGGEVRVAGERRSPEQEATARALAEREGLALIPPYDHPDVILGQATCAWEVLQQCPEVATLVAPVSGGGLLAGTGAAVRASGRAIEVVAAEPAGAAKLSAALAAGAPVRLAGTDTIADGLLTPQVGQLTWPIIRAVVARAVTVDEAEIAGAVRWLCHALRLVVEPSGAVPVAALLGGALRPRGPVVAILSGGNVDPAVHARLVA